MRITTSVPTIARLCILIPAVAIGGRGDPAKGGNENRTNDSETTRNSAQFSPYAADPDHPWNRLHQALFIRDAADGSRFTHSTDPLLYRGGTFLLDGEPHRTAIELLDQFLARSDDRLIDDPLKRLFLQHDLWAAFDYASWYPDDWVFKSKYEPAAVALRNRLARAVGRLAFGDREIAALPDNYARAVQAKQYATAYDPKHPERPFLPPDLFDAKGSWVRFHEPTANPMAQQHFDGAGGRAVHVILLRLPGGREETERYLKELHPGEPLLRELHRLSLKQFPPGTMVAMVRRPLTVDRAAKVRVTPVTELVQIRVYRRIPEDPEANYRDDQGGQDVYEFLLDRTKLFAGQHGLRAVGPEDPAEPFFDRNQRIDPFERSHPLAAGGPQTPDVRTMQRSHLVTPGGPQLKTCIECHQSPGVYSVLSMVRGLRDANPFRTYDWEVEMSFTVRSKVKQYDWGLLQGKLEAK
jgi:hypothetical protein